MAWILNRNFGQRDNEIELTFKEMSFDDRIMKTVDVVIHKDVMGDILAWFMEDLLRENRERL